MTAYTELPVDPRKASVNWTRCPAHGWRVGLTPSGHLAGRCPSCAADAVEARTIIERGDA